MKEICDYDLKESECRIRQSMQTVQGKTEQYLFRENENLLNANMFGRDYYQIFTYSGHYDDRICIFMSLLSIFSNQRNITKTF